LFFVVEWLIILPGGATEMKSSNILYSVIEWLPTLPARTVAALSFLHRQPENSTANAFFTVKIWIVIMLVQALLSGAVSYSAFWHLREMWRCGRPETRRSRIRVISLRVLPFACALYVLLPPERGWNLGAYQYDLRVLWSGGMPIFAAGIATIAMWSLEQHVREITACCVLRDLARFIRLRQSIQTMLSMSSAILALGVFSLFARRALVLVVSKNNVFSEWQVLLQALEYTVMIGLAYIPVHSSVNQAALRLRDAILPRVTDSQASLVLDFSKSMTGLDEMLQVRLHDWKSLGPGFAILAPSLLGLIANVAGRHI
jgi:hypothetical protein